MEFVIIYITHKNIKEARKLAAHLFDKNLIACVNYFPIESSYRWKGKIKNVKETVSVVKTRKENWKKVRDEVKRIHPYEIPCIMKIEAEANQDYADWIKNETK